MLVPRPCSKHAGARNSRTLHFLWPIPLSHADLPMIPVAIGGLIGLYLLFHGCILLQRRPRSSRSTRFRFSLQRPAQVRCSPRSKSPSNRPQAKSFSSVPTVPREIPTPSRERSQSFPRAGAFSPASWTAAEDSPTATLHLTDEQTTRAARPGDVVESLELNVSKVLKKAASNDPHPLTHGAGNQPFRWKPALMVWFGPILTITCLYILALHFGWM